MARTLPTGYETAANAQVFPPVFLVYLDWPGGAVRAWNGYGNISWDSQTWYGTGEFGQISPIGESSDLRANGVQLTLSGIPSELIAEAFANDIQGVAAKIWLAPLNTSTGAFIADPLCLFDGVIDNTAFEENGETSTISVNLEKELIDRRSDPRRYTHEDQQIDAAGDLFFEYVAWLAQNPISFGPVTASTGTSPGASAPANMGQYVKDQFPGGILN